MNIAQKNLTIISISMLLIGLFIGSFIPQIASQIMPQQTIYDKLNNAGIPFQVATDGDFSDHCNYATHPGYIAFYAYSTGAYFDGAISFNQFKANYFYTKIGLSDSLSLNVFVDPQSKIIWMEEDGLNGLYVTPMNITILWFHAYTEPN